jgi:hypothetical protein
MRIHQSLDARVLTPPSIVTKSGVQRGFPSTQLPTSGDVYQYARGDGDLLEDVGKRDWVFDAPPRTHKYLVVCSHDKEGWQSFRKYETQVEAYLGVDMNASNTLFLGGRDQGSLAFPADVPSSMVFDVILFAGCNWAWTLGFDKRDAEDTIPLFLRMAHGETKILFTENTKKIQAYLEEEDSVFPDPFRPYAETGGITAVEVIGHLPGRVLPEVREINKNAGEAIQQLLTRAKGDAHYTFRTLPTGRTGTTESEAKIQMRKRALDWLAASLASARPDSPHAMPTLYNIGGVPLFMLDDWEDRRDEGAHRRGVAWDTLSTDEGVALTFTVAAWENSPATIDVYWVALSGEPKEVEEMGFRGRNLLLEEGEWFGAIVEVHTFEWKPEEMVSTLFSAESTGQTYTSDEVEDIFREKIHDRAGPGTLRTLLRRNAPVVDLWDPPRENGIPEFGLMPDLEYYGMFMGGG